jgi:hypothetical protein
LDAVGRKKFADEFCVAFGAQSWGSMAAHENLPCAP